MIKKSEHPGKPGILAVKVPEQFLTKAQKKDRTYFGKERKPMVLRSDLTNNQLKFYRKKYPKGNLPLPSR